jgi:HSP20 family protein
MKDAATQCPEGLFLVKERFMANETKTTQSEAAGQKAEAQREGLQGSRQQPGQQGGALQERRWRGELTHYNRNPFAVMQELSNEMDRLFDSFFYGTPARGRTAHESVPSLWAPAVDVSEEGNELRVCVDLPGISKDNVKIDVQEGALVIQGERREERAEGGEDQGFRRSERRHGSFYRAIPLPDYVDTEKADARMKDGVLNITLPITQQRRQARRLEIQG